MNKLNGVFIIPTGLECALGGDAAYMPGVKLISECTNNLIVNPNAVNASDINEMPSNALYVEGSTIDRFLEGKLNLRKVKTHNKILLAVNSPASVSKFNMMNAGIWGLGAEIEMVELKTPLLMKAIINADGTAGGEYSGIDELVEQVSEYEYDALALSTPIDGSDEDNLNYWNNGGVNPWGGIEAIVSKIIAEKINKPIAHGPEEDDVTGDLYRTIHVKKDMAPEIISLTFMFCVLKGLHKAPRLEFDKSKMHPDILSNEDVDFLLTPHGCWGRPHDSCYNRNIPIIVVRENTTCFSENYHTKWIYPSDVIFVDNYLEAAGVIMSMNAGVHYKQILRY